MQQPTCTGLRVRSPSDAHVIFHGVALGILPMISRRLDTEERRAISSGCVFVWEERGPNTEATGLGIERWTDSIHWGPSRVRDEFLFYQEKDHSSKDMDLGSDSDRTTPPRTVRTQGFSRESLIKQTYSVFVETIRGRRKWHLIAYFTQDTLDYLGTIEDSPELASLHVPPGKYKSARSSKGRPRDLDYYPGDPTSQQIVYSSSYSPDSPHMRICGGTLSRRTIVDGLAPLAYLLNIPPPRRHPVDEKALMSLNSWLA